MRRGPGQALRIGLAPNGVALVRTGWWRRGLEVAGECGAHGGAGQALRQLFRDAPAAGWPVTVVLSDELVRMWQVTPPAAASRMADLEAAAALRFQSLFGAPAAHWKIAADWDAAGPFLAAAAPLELLEQLGQAAHEHRFHLVEVVPQFVAAMNQWRKLRKPGAWFGVLHAGVLTLAAYQGATLAAVRAAAVPAGAGREWLDSLVAREALRLGLERPDRVQVCGPAPAGWASHPAQPGFACSLLDPAQPGGWSDLALLARTGSAA
ncbi:MAG: hypothetical protein ACJ8LG_01185 [Massilia sp.]